MKPKKKLVSFILMFPIFFIAIHIWWLSRMNGTETFPEDNYLESESNKTALIVVAHDDDAIGCAGTVCELTKKGWKVHFLTFYGNYRKEDNPIRKREAARAAQIQNLASSQLIDFPIQKSDTVSEPWLPIPYTLFAERMQLDSIENIVAATIARHRPSVLFTLDTIIGGYGHPEHVAVSRCALRAARRPENSFVKKIYQAVFTRTLNENVLRDNPAFIAAKKVYQADGSPQPSVQINITNSSREKSDVMEAYTSQARNIKKIWPYHHIYPHWLYFRIFSHEHFHVVSVSR